MKLFMKYSFALTFVLVSCGVQDQIKKPILDIRDYKNVTIKKLGASRGCPLPYGTVSLDYVPQIKKKSQLKKMLNNLAFTKRKFVADKYFQIPPAFGAKTTIYKQVISDWDNFTSESFDPSNGSNVGRFILVPSGSELYVANELKMAGVISGAFNGGVGCGPTEFVWFTVPASDFNFEDPSIFEAFLRKHMKNFVNIKKNAKFKNKGVFIDKALVTSPIEPKFSIKVFTVHIGSEVSRNTASDHVWDSFEVVFKMISLENGDYRIFLHTDDLRHAARTGRITPPSSDHYRKKGEYGDNAGEYAIALTIANFIAGASKCGSELQIDILSLYKVPECKLKN